MLPLNHPQRCKVVQCHASSPLVACSSKRRQGFIEPAFHVYVIAQNFDVNRIHWQNRTHFLAVAAQTMRRILVEFARQRHRQKRGGGAMPVTMTDAEHIAHELGPDLVALSDALSALASFDPRMSQVVELRFFGGLTVQETADVLNVSPETVMRDWKTAKVWLLRELSLSSSPPRGQH